METLYSSSSATIWQIHYFITILIVHHKLRGWVFKSREEEDYGHEPVADLKGGAIHK